MLRSQEQFADEGGLRRAAAESLFRADFDHIGIIIFLRDVAQHQVARAAIKTIGIGEIFANRVIGKMASAGENALLNNPGIRPHLQHFQIVIGFQNQAVGIAQMNFYQFWKVAEVRDDGHLDAFGAESEANRVGSVMRNRERVYVYIADSEMLAGMHGFDATQTFFQAIGKNTLQRIESWFGNVKRGFIETQHLRQAVAVIGMFVGDENSVDSVESSFAGGQSGESFAFAKSAINEEAGARSFEQRDVAGTAGSQDGYA